MEPLNQHKQSQDDDSIVWFIILWSIGWLLVGIVFGIYLSTLWKC